jgi:superfamily II DNA/RNA helicase
MTQSLRNNAISEFKSGKKRILVSTDVAARGLDIPRLEIVVNWDMPSRLEQYVHRVGRTGRNGASGRSFTFFTRNFAFLAPDLVELLRRHNQEIDPNLLNLAENAPAMFEKEKKKRKRSDTNKDISFKDKCWLAGSQGGKSSGDGDMSTKKNPKKRRRGKRGGKKHSKKKSRKVIPI